MSSEVDERLSEWREWAEEFQGESDRACAVLAGAFIDEQIAFLLRSFFVDDPKSVRRLMTVGPAPLATSYAKTELAYGLGFLAPIERRDLNLIRKVRNEFAHQLHGLDFENERIAAWCRELDAGRVLLKRLPGARPREQFVMAAFVLAQRIALRRLGIRDEKRVVKKEVETVPGEDGGGGA